MVLVRNVDMHLSFFGCIFDRILPCMAILGLTQTYRLKNCLFCREGGDASKRWSFLPTGKQYLITRNGKKLIKIHLVLQQYIHFFFNRPVFFPWLFLSQFLAFKERLLTSLMLITPTLRILVKMSREVIGLLPLLLRMSKRSLTPLKSCPVFRIPLEQ
jgi:hypothetical protein